MELNASKYIETPIGQVKASANSKGICLLKFVDPKSLEKETFTSSENGYLNQLETELFEYFSKKRRHFNVPIVIEGTPFQKEVWRALQRVPYGKTISYKDQATSMNRAKGFRAIAQANRCNKIAIIIPCHRVIGKNGHLTGYAGGLDKKKYLLDLEANI